MRLLINKIYFRGAKAIALFIVNIACVLTLFTLVNRRQVVSWETMSAQQGRLFFGKLL